MTVTHTPTNSTPKLNLKRMHSGSKLFRCSIRCQLDAWSGLNRLKQVETGSEEGSKQVDVCIVSTYQGRRQKVSYLAANWAGERKVLFGR